MSYLRKISRYQAASYHLAISLSISTLIFATMLLLWYPPALLSAMGGKELMLLIGGIDVGLGPLITLIIFNPRKKSLPFDLGVIALVQLVAMSYGVYTMLASRPVFAVYADGAIHVVSAIELDAKDLAQGKQDNFRRLSWNGPLLVAAQAPTEVEEKNNLAFSALAGMGIQNFPKYYVSYETQQKEALKSSRPVTDLKLTPDEHRQLADYAKRLRIDITQLQCLPAMTRFGQAVALLEGHSGQFLKFAPYAPNLVPHRE